PARPQAQLELLVLEAGAHPPGPFGAEVLGVLPHPFEGVDGGGERPLELAQDPCTPCEDRAHRAQGIGVRAPESAHPPPVPLLLARPGRAGPCCRPYRNRPPRHGPWGGLPIPWPARMSGRTGAGSASEHGDDAAARTPGHVRLER